MQSDFLLVPVYPRRKDVEAAAAALSPIDLPNYGERAWCRLEVGTTLHTPPS